MYTFVIDVSLTALMWQLPYTLKLCYCYDFDFLFVVDAHALQLLIAVVLQTLGWHRLGFAAIMAAALAVVVD